MPYIYTTAEEMSRTGLPMMRPLFLEFPDSTAEGQPIDLANSSAFLLGPDLLVADSPYPDEVGDYTVALPPVGWYDYWTGAEITQGTVQIHPSLKTLPVFVRAGAIIPEQPLVQSTDEKPEGPLNLRVYPPAKAGGECRGSLYLDDGVSYAFEKGEFLSMSFTCRKTADGLSLTISPREGSFAPWWDKLFIEVYGAGKAAQSASLTRHGSTTPLLTGHANEDRIIAVIPDDGKGMEIKLAY
jgi:alpha-glucosidase